MLNFETIDKLISMYMSMDDDYSLDLICDELETFEEYHSAIYSMEIKLKVKNSKSMNREDYQYMVESLDKKRTMLHNRVLIAVNVLNRMASKENMQPVYDGVVSEERPYRREVANAVLEYVEKVIKERR